MRRTLFGALIAALVSSTVARTEPWLSWSATPSVSVNGVAKVTVEIDSARAGGPRIWVAKRIEEHVRRPVTVQWADSRSCLAMLPTLETLTRLEPLKIQPPGVPGAYDTELDGTYYELFAHGFYPAEKAGGDIRLTGNVDSPLEKWSISAGEALASCWRDDAPKLDR